MVRLKTKEDNKEDCEMDETHYTNDGNGRVNDNIKKKKIVISSTTKTEKNYSVQSQNEVDFSEKFSKYTITPFTTTTTIEAAINNSSRKNTRKSRS